MHPPADRASDSLSSAQWKRKRGGFPSSDALDAMLHLYTSVVLSTLFI